MIETSGSATLRYPLDGAPAAGGALQVLPGIHWLRMPLPFKLNHVNLWVLEDGNGLTLVDSGLGTDVTRGLWLKALATSLPQMPVKRLLVTHHHPDHSGLAGWLSTEHGVPLLMAPDEYAAVRSRQEQMRGFDVRSLEAQFSRHGMGAVASRALLEQGDSRTVWATLPPSFTPLAEGDSIEIGSHSWRVIIGQGHAPEHVSLYSRSADALISGDMVLPQISPNIGCYQSRGDDNPLALFLSSVNRLAQLPAETLVLPSHGRPFYGLQARVAQLDRHHEDRCRAMLDALDTPRSASELLEVLFGGDLDALQTVLAMCETVAHLTYVEQRGDARRIMGSDGMIRYVAVPSRVSQGP